MLRQAALWAIAVLLVVTVLVPAVLVGNLSWGSEGVPEVGEATTITDLIVNVYDNESHELLELPLEQYIVGVVAAEMPASFELEAIKAQAVVARTYTVGKMKIFGGPGCPDHPRADICTDPGSYQAWIDASEMRSRWGVVGYYFNHRKLERAVVETQGLIVTYNGIPIEAVYHSTSGGRTEVASAVWGADEPYLQSVESPNEQASPKFATTVRRSLPDLAAALQLPASELRAALRSGGVTIQEQTPGGRAAQVAIGGHTWTGREFREALELPSTWFQATTEGDTVILDVRGYGHGVGMSQWGAQGMAADGATYQEIIAHYYQGVEVRPIFAE